MRKIIFLSLILLASAACGSREPATPPPGEKNPNQTRDQDGSKDQKDQKDGSGAREEKKPELTARQKRVLFCQNNPQEPGCACLLDESSEQCRCARNVGLTAKETDRCEFCSNLDHIEDEKCACFRDPTSRECACQKDDSQAFCKPNIVAFCERVCRDREHPTILDDPEFEKDYARDADCDADGLTNSAEYYKNRDTDAVEKRSNPCIIDSDNDGLTDYEEINVTGSNPNNPDSDGDGISDYREVELGLNPKAASSDGVTKDSQLWLVNACDTIKGDDLSSKRTPITNEFASITFTYASSFTPTELDLGGVQGKTNQDYAAFFNSTYISAGLVSIPSSKIATQGDILRQALQSLPLSTYGVTTLNSFEGVTGTSYDKYKFSTSEYTISTLPISKDALRQKLLPIFTGVAKNAGITNFPTVDTTEYTRFELKVTALYREKTKQIIYLYTVTPSDFLATTHGKREEVLADIADFTNTTGLSVHNADASRISCSNIRASGNRPEAYFYFVLDGSGSMREENRILSSLAATFFAKLRNSELKFKIGLTDMCIDLDPIDSTSKTAIRPQNYGVVSGWFTEDNDFQNAITQNILGAGACGIEIGLETSLHGIELMQSANKVAAGQRINSNATLITTVMTDEVENRVYNGVDFYINRLKPKTTLFAIVNESYSKKPTSPDNRYVLAAKGTGGAYAPLPEVSDQASQSEIDKAIATLGPTLDKIINTASGLSSEFELPATPITSTLQVYKITGVSSYQFLLRSRENGYEYNPRENTLSFFGDARPSSSRKDSYIVYFNYYKLPRKL